jgi:hypothetical protein
MVTTLVHNLSSNPVAQVRLNVLPDPWCRRVGRLALRVATCVPAAARARQHKDECKSSVKIYTDQNDKT